MTLAKTSPPSSIAEAKESVSCMRLMPGPEVAVKAGVPSAALPMAIAPAAISLSAWTNSAPTDPKCRLAQSTTSLTGVIGYPAAIRKGKA
jgi:hypothetical protein